MSPALPHTETAADPAGIHLVATLRASAAYVHAHHGRTFVIYLPGEAAASARFADLIYDIALLHSFGVRLVLVSGARPQIDAALNEAGHDTSFVEGVRVTDATSLAYLKQVVGSLQMDLEALLSTSLASTPMGGASIATVNGNMITARPVGVSNGVDHGHTGEVRRLDTPNINAHLARGHVVLLSCIGYSPSGEIFNLHAEEVASAAAAGLAADKFVLLHPGDAMHQRFADTPPSLTVEAARTLMNIHGRLMSSADRARIVGAIAACEAGVEHSHLVSFELAGALLRELYSHEGVGTMVAAGRDDEVRTASPEDLSGVLALVEPLANAGILVTRSRNSIEENLAQYVVTARDGLVTACCALMPYPAEALGELACVAVHPSYRGQNRAAVLLTEIEQRARRAGLNRLFVLTTKAPHWFIEHGFEASTIDSLPAAKRTLYNEQRNSAVLIKTLAA